MIYSVWDQGAGRFDYYDDGRQQAALNAEAPTHLVSRALGSTIDQAAWPLPADAKRVGAGPDPVGKIASPRGAALGSSLTADTGKLALVAAAGAVALLLWSGRRRSR